MIESLLGPRYVIIDIIARLSQSGELPQPSQFVLQWSDSHQQGKVPMP